MNRRRVGFAARAVVLQRDLECGLDRLRATRHEHDRAELRAARRGDQRLQFLERVARERVPIAVRDLPQLALDRRGHLRVAVAEVRTPPAPPMRRGSACRVCRRRSSRAPEAILGRPPGRSALVSQAGSRLLMPEAAVCHRALAERNSTDRQHSFPDATRPGAAEHAAHAAPRSDQVVRPVNDAQASSGVVNCSAARRAYSELLTMSSVCVPVATMRPWSMTMMRSAFRTVASRAGAR